MINHYFLKLAFLFAFLVVSSTLAKAQSSNVLDSLKIEYEKTILLLDTSKKLSKKEKDRLIAHRDKLDAEMRAFWERKLLIQDKAADLYGKGALIEEWIQKDSTLSYKMRDSLYQIANELMQRGRETGQYGKLFLNKKDTVKTIITSIAHHKQLWEKEIEALIKISSDEAVFPIDRDSAILKLATYDHPATRIFLAKNLATIYFPISDEGMYGWMSYYAYEPHYSCFVALMKSKPDWNLIPAIEAALRNRVVEENRANLYGRLLNEITKGCIKCRDELLLWYRDHSDQNTEDGKRLRENAIRIMGYFANPTRLD